MATSRNLTTIAIAAVLAFAALVLVTSSPVGTTPSALAGPCGALPLLHDRDAAPTSPGIIALRLFVNEPGKFFSDKLAVDTVPPILPLGKPPVTITVIEEDGHEDILVWFDPDEAGGSFNTEIFVVVGPDVQNGIYDYTIEIECHEEFTEVPFSIWVGTCPIAEAGFNIAGVATPPVTPTASPEEFPEDCSSPSETPGAGTTTPTPTFDPTPTATSTFEPTPTASPSDSPTDPFGEEVVWGNWNCSGDPLDPPDPVDALLNLRDDAGLPTNTGDCPDMGSGHTLVATANLIWGDGDCSGAADPVDALKILRVDSGLNATQEENCPGYGDTVVLAPVS